jgi:hypothetical protein
MKGFLRDNGLSLVLIALFVLFFAGQTVFGWLNRNLYSRSGVAGTVNHSLESSMRLCEGLLKKQTTIFLVVKVQPETDSPCARRLSASGAFFRGDLWV